MNKDVLAGALLATLGKRQTEVEQLRERVDATIVAHIKELTMYRAELDRKFSIIIREIIEARAKIDDGKEGKAR